MNTFARIATLGTLFLLVGACLSAGQKVGDPLPPGPPSDLPAAGLQRLDAGSDVRYDQTQRNRYRTLLKTIESPGDRGVYGDFCDYGYWQGNAYAGANWIFHRATGVYLLAPNWYIFKDNATSSTPPPPLAPRAWGPEQAVGAPDTWPKSGDIGTAWASKTPDGQEEWLQLTYAAPVHPTAVLVYETYNPGALSRITCVAEDGKETDLWTGSDPTAPGSTKGISVVPIHPRGGSQVHPVVSRFPESARLERNRRRRPGGRSGPNPLGLLRHRQQHLRRQHRPAPTPDPHHFRSPVRPLNPTASQLHKPLIGSGRAKPASFERSALSEQTLVLGSDGLVKYAPPQRICEVARLPELQPAAGKMVDLVRLRSGELQDDVAIILCRRRIGLQLGVWPSCSEAIHADRASPRPITPRSQINPHAGAETERYSAERRPGFSEPALMNPPPEFIKRPPLIEPPPHIRGTRQVRTPPVPTSRNAILSRHA